MDPPIGGTELQGQDGRPLAQRRGLAVAALAVAVGAGLMLLGATRVWWVQVVPQPAPLRPEEIAHTGASIVPLLPALGLVALAGVGGLLATRGLGRRLVGGLISLAAAVGAILALRAIVGADPVNPAWPAVCVVGALLAGVGGGLAVRFGVRWPVMGRRYARGTPGDEPRGRSAGPSAGQGPTPSTGGDGRAPESAQLWDALDRGEDLTRD